ncbi:SRPBCC family protein [Streptomyces sp. NPDC058953]|uniref:SRPBCC family protein n=1 Tax=Streptomyces sp. NPDC058953 TaxID=3346676 RepID=UPI0036957B1A
MASPVPTGRLLTDGDGGTALVLARTLAAAPDEVWAHLTESARTALWYGPWRGEPGPGAVVEVRTAFEEGDGWSPFTIEVCEPPRRLLVTAGTDAAAWRLEASLSAGGGRTAVELRHHLPGGPVTGLGEIGPGWEYYLDMFTASFAGVPLPVFATYYPALRGYYEELARSGG